MGLFEVTIIKIGKLATPAVAVLAGVILVLNNYLTLGVAVILLGIASYIFIWLRAERLALKLARDELHKEKLKLAREKERKERAYAQMQDKNTQIQIMAEKARFDETKLKQKWIDRVAKDIWKSI